MEYKIIIGVFLIGSNNFKIWLDKGWLKIKLDKNINFLVMKDLFLRSFYWLYISSYFVSNYFERGVDCIWELL